MASYTVTLAGGTAGTSGEKTTSGSTADTATIAGADKFASVEVFVTSASGYVDVRLDGTAASSAVDSTAR